MKFWKLLRRAFVLGRIGFLFIVKVEIVGHLSNGGYSPRCLLIQRLRVCLKSLSGTTSFYLRVLGLIFCIGPTFNLISFKHFASILSSVEDLTPDLPWLFMIPISICWRLFFFKQPSVEDLTSKKLKNR